MSYYSQGQNMPQLSHISHITFLIIEFVQGCNDMCRWLYPSWVGEKMDWAWPLRKILIHGKLNSLVFHSSFLTGSAVLIVIEFCMYAQCSISEKTIGGSLFCFQWLPSARKKGSFKGLQARPLSCSYCLKCWCPWLGHRWCQAFCQLWLAKWDWGVCT